MRGPVQLRRPALAQREHRGGAASREAPAAYRKILALRPDVTEAHHDLGNGAQTA